MNAAASAAVVPFFVFLDMQAVGGWEDLAADLSDSFHGGSVRLRSGEDPSDLPWPSNLHGARPRTRSARLSTTARNPSLPSMTCAGRATSACVKLPSVDVTRSST
ncbi:hypothetical protein BD311DRAFT_755336 [Dichomitus squalens]|uniref:Uncharacterized protein n=1 Tax=Dichomitus squalens TaxID=114155 RepID=A0A4Q9MQV0_9APHY|nr:hypothetical protein BD311DRAFT_755336 [Dichomitus squalens]